jgi:hypothetical protein
MRYKTQLPTRLLDLGSLPQRTDFESVQGDPRALLENTALQLVENSPDSEGLYMALSYCWGNSLPYTTTCKNLQKRKDARGIEYLQLPKTCKMPSS